MVWNCSQFFCMERKWNMKEDIKREEKQLFNIEKVKEEAFLEGYQYAIKILSDGLVKKEKTD